MAEGVRKWRKDGEETPYQYWHRHRLADACVAVDVDQIEIRGSGDGRRPAAVIELTRASADVITSGHPYMQKIIDRYDSGPPQSWLACRVARALGVNAYVFVYDEALMVDASSEADDQPVALRNLTRRKGWRYTDRHTYGKWLTGLGDL